MPPRQTAIRVMQSSCSSQTIPEMWVSVVDALDWTNVTYRAQTLCYRNATGEPDGECARHRDNPIGTKVCGESIAAVLTAASAYDLAREAKGVSRETP